MLLHSIVEKTTINKTGNKCILAYIMCQINWSQETYIHSNIRTYTYIHQKRPDESVATNNKPKPRSVRFPLDKSGINLKNFHCINHLEL